MSELSNVKPTDVKITIGGKERNLKYGFSAWAKLEEKYDGIKNIARMEADMVDRPFQTLPFLIWIGLTDKEGLSEDTVLDEFGMEDLKEISDKVAIALYGSVPAEVEEKKIAKKK